MRKEPIVVFKRRARGKRCWDPHCDGTIREEDAGSHKLYVCTKCDKSEAVRK